MRKTNAQIREEKHNAALAVLNSIAAQELGIPQRKRRRRIVAAQTVSTDPAIIWIKQYRKDHGCRLSEAFYAWKEHKARMGKGK